MKLEEKKSLRKRKVGKQFRKVVKWEEIETKQLSLNEKESRK